MSVLTKRFMLSSVSTMYDPLGLVIPVVIRGRMLFQQTTKLKLGWDVPVPSELTVKWVHWWNDLKNLSTVLFDRCVIPTEFSDAAIELHHFCDGSQQAYGACTYIRISSKTGLIHVQLLAAKARLTPMRTVTIPRIELCAAVMAVKADEMLRNELGLDLLPSIFWSDSKVALSYIRCESHRLRVFVANRVALIRSNTTVDQWKYVPSGENPADVLSRGCSPNVIPKMWKLGPDFLLQHKHRWSFDVPAPHAVDQDDPEVKKVTCSMMVAVPDQNNHPIGKLISYYSDYYRLKKAVDWLVRWVQSMSHSKDVNTGLLTVSELGDAEHILVKRVQEAEYEAEISQLRDGNAVKHTSHIKGLDPVLMNGLLVVGGRLKHAPLSVEGRHPSILPPRHELSRLILYEAHRRAHLGTEWVLSCVRKALDTRCP